MRSTPIFQFDSLIKLDLSDSLMIMTSLIVSYIYDSNSTDLLLFIYIK